MATTIQSSARIIHSTAGFVAIAEWRQDVDQDASPIGPPRQLVSVWGPQGGFFGSFADESAAVAEVEALAAEPGREPQSFLAGHSLRATPPIGADKPSVEGGVHRSSFELLNEHGRILETRRRAIDAIEAAEELEREFLAQRSRARRQMRR